MDPLLIDAGPSRRGWSRLGTYLRCPQLFAFKYRAGIREENGGVGGDTAGTTSLGGGDKDALVKGSLMHVALAHRYAELMVGADVNAARGGPTAVWVPGGASGLLSDEAKTAGVTWRNAERLLPSRVNALPYLTWSDAIEVYCVRHEEARPFADLVRATMHLYLRSWHGETTTVAAIEHEMGILLGDPLDVPGHPEHGTSQLYTQRLDLIQITAAGLTVWDHKTSSSTLGASKINGYSASGQFHGFHVLGLVHFGADYRGCVLNYVQFPKGGKRPDNGRFERPGLAPAPHLTQSWLDNARMAEKRIAELDVETQQGKRTVWDWPKAMHEQVCIGRYGVCPALKLCMKGKANA